jgi:molybdate transport system regulatory protein
MNRLEGTIRRIASSESMSLVEVDVGGHRFFSVVLERPDDHPYLKEGNAIVLLFKDTEVALAKGPRGRISILNAAEGTVRTIEPGTLLTRVDLDFKGHAVASVVATRSAEELDLSEGDAVLWLVKANEVSLMEP